MSANSPDPSAQNEFILFFHTISTLLLLLHVTKLLCFYNNLFDSPCKGEDNGGVLSSKSAACHCFSSEIPWDVHPHVRCHFNLLQIPFVQYPRVGRWGEMLEFYLKKSFNAFSLRRRLSMCRSDQMWRLEGCGGSILKLWNGRPFSDFFKPLVSSSLHIIFQSELPERKPEVHNVSGKEKTFYRQFIPFSIWTMYCSKKASWVNLIRVPRRGICCLSWGYEDSNTG